MNKMTALKKIRVLLGEYQFIVRVVLCVLVIGLGLIISNPAQAGERYNNNNNDAGLNFRHNNPSSCGIVVDSAAGDIGFGGEVGREPATFTVYSNSNKSDTVTLEFDYDSAASTHAFKDKRVIIKLDGKSSRPLFDGNEITVPIYGDGKSKHKIYAGTTQPITDFKSGEVTLVLEIEIECD